MTSLSDKFSDTNYWKIGDLTKKFGVARSTIYRWVEAGHFPQPVVLGPEQDKFSAKRWLEEDITDWLKARPRQTYESD